MLTNQNKQQVKDWFKILKDQICKSFEEIENKKIQNSKIRKLKY